MSMKAGTITGIKKNPLRFILNWKTVENCKIIAKPTTKHPFLSFSELIGLRIYLVIIVVFIDSFDLFLLVYNIPMHLFASGVPALMIPGRLQATHIQKVSI